MTTISASSTAGIYLNPPSSTYTNPVVINLGVTVSSSNFDAIYTYGTRGSTAAWTIVNNGSIVSPLYSGIYLGHGGQVTNAAGAAISGYDGINITGGSGTVINDGSIAGNTTSSIGVFLGAGGSVTNQSGGTISGYAGVDLASGGAVTNAASAEITGVFWGVNIAGGTGTIVNQGHIAGTGVGGVGVALGSGGSITNAASASITGAALGVDLSASGTLTNAGTIVGNTGTAVYLGGTGSNLLVLAPGYGLSGIAMGAASATNTLELASAASAGTLSGLGTEFVNFTQVTVASGATWHLDGANTLAAGATITNLGTLIPTDATFTDDGDLINSGSIVLDPSTITVGSWLANVGDVQINSGTDTLTTPMILTGTSTADAATNIANGDVGEWQLSQGATLIINTNTIDAGQAIVFEGTTDTLVIGQVVNGGSDGIIGTLTTILADAENLLASGGFAAQIWGFQAGDEILFNNLPVTADSIVGGNTLDLFGLGDLLEGSLIFYDSSGGPATATEMDAAAAQVICFCKGTLIMTPDGEVPVETLQAGDRVVTLHGEARPIVWIGVGCVLATRGRRSAATPVVVRKGALADNVPHHDLRVTKGHSFHLDGVLIPVEFLVNHRSIEWDDRAQEVEIYHVELETHDVLLANGAPTESYRDDGNRWLFQNANDGWQLSPQEPCAQVLTGGAIVDTVWRRLLERTGPRPVVPLTDDPDLHLIVDGCQVDVAAQSLGWHIFRLAAVPATVRIVSRTVVPQELGLARDPRCLGVALRQITVTKGAQIRTVEAADALLQDGFHDYEAVNDIRWTDGDAGVPADLFEGIDGALEIALRLGGETRYPDNRALPERRRASSG